MAFYDIVVAGGGKKNILQDRFMIIKTRQVSPFINMDRIFFIQK